MSACGCKINGLAMNPGELISGCKINGPAMNPGELISGCKINGLAMNVKPVSVTTSIKQ
jgi:hypothetical protein